MNIRATVTGNDAENYPNGYHGYPIGTPIVLMERSFAPAGLEIYNCKNAVVVTDEVYGRTYAPGEFRQFVRSDMFQIEQ